MAFSVVQAFSRASFCGTASCSLWFVCCKTVIISLFLFIAVHHRHVVESMSSVNETEVIMRIVSEEMHKIPLSDIIKDIFLIQRADRVHFLTKYFHGGGGLINDEQIDVSDEFNVVYTTSTDDTESNVVVIPPGHDCLPFPNTRRVFTVLRHQPETKPVRYYAMIAYVRDAQIEDESESDSGHVVTFGKRKFVIEWDLWDEHFACIGRRRLDNMFCIASLISPCDKDESSSVQSEINIPSIDTHISGRLDDNNPNNVEDTNYDLYRDLDLRQNEADHPTTSKATMHDIHRDILCNVLALSTSTNCSVTKNENDLFMPDSNKAWKEENTTFSKSEITKFPTTIGKIGNQLLGLGNCPLSQVPVLQHVKDNNANVINVIAFHMKILKVHCIPWKIEFVYHLLRDGLITVNETVINFSPAAMDRLTQPKLRPKETMQLQTLMDLHVFSVVYLQEYGQNSMNVNKPDLSNQASLMETNTDFLIQFGLKYLDIVRKSHRRHLVHLTRVLILTFEKILVKLDATSEECEACNEGEDRQPHDESLRKTDYNVYVRDFINFLKFGLGTVESTEEAFLLFLNGQKLINEPNQQFT